jgi:dolichyl-phosphate-mannose-protein mannosyltransferase
VWTAAALASAVCAATAVLVWHAERAPDLPFLSARAPAEWIVRATPPSTVAKPAREQVVEFHRRFALDAVPATARLRVRLFRGGAALLNGAPIGALEASADGDWKAVREADVATLLRVGENELVLRAREAVGPPAAWGVLELPGGVAAATDATWIATREGGAPEPVRLATAPMRDWAPPAPARASPTWSERVVPLAVLAAASALGLEALRRSRVGPGPWLVALAVFGFAALWWRDRGLPLDVGFDAAAHLDYVRFIAVRHRLPLASDGWAMYHPPLYYAAAAAVVSAFGESGTALRALNALAAGVQCAALYGALRVVFPGQPRRVFAGFALGACVPMQLYLAQYVTNELLCAALASCALWLCLRIAAQDLRGARVHAALGALLGAALLAKFSALIPAAVVLAVLAGRLVARRERAPRAWLASVGTVVAALVAVCGWHYARVALHFGTPIVGNWDSVVGRPWWQDPGYHTVNDYLRFGESLTHPVFSACNGCLDGLYSTLWADGLIGGMASVADAPHWSWSLVRLGVWLALVPTAAVVLGFAAWVAELVRAPSAAGWLLVGTALATGFALVALSLRLPFYAQCKAFYGLSALVPFAAFGGAGLDLAAARLGRAAPALWLAFGTWALCAVASYWVS